MSSRNRRLSEEELAIARQLNGLLRNENLSTEEVALQLDKLGFRVEYCEERWNRRFVAAHLGAVRLIDNVEMADAVGI